MTCKRCPHHVRHGKLSDDKQNILFADLCALKLKQLQDHEPLNKKGRGRGRPTAEPVRKKAPSCRTAPDCQHFPFSKQFDYFHCEVYQHTFDSKGLRNGVLPTKDFQYSERLAGLAVTDMELL